MMFSPSRFDFEESLITWREYEKYGYNTSFKSLRIKTIVSDEKKVLD